MAAKTAWSSSLKRERNATPAGRKIDLTSGMPTTIVQGEVNGKMRSWTLAGHHQPMVHVLRTNREMGLDTKWIDGRGKPIMIPTSKMSGGKCKQGPASK